MKWKITWSLLALAAVLLAFIVLIERHWRSTSEAAGPLDRLLNFKAVDVTNIQLRLTNQLLLRVERSRTETPWSLTLPISYPAQTLPIEWLLQTVEGLTPVAHIPQSELAGKKQTVAQFGLDIPQATLTLQHNGQRMELQFGAKTAVGDQVYLQVQNQPGIYLVNSEVFDRLPRSHNDWRDTGLLDLIGVGFNRLEVRGATRGFAVEFDPTNRNFFLTKPTVARADQAKIEALLRTVRDAPVVKFVSDHPRPDLEQYGLQPPALELAFMLGTNDLVVVQFGKSPTNDPSAVYARRMSQTNIVLTPKSVFDVLQVSAADLRDLRLVSLPPGASVDAIEVVGTENFTLRHLTNATWVVEGAQPTLADADLVREWLGVLARLEGSVEKEVVTDLTTYGLNPPARQYLIKSAVTNATGSVSNRVVAELHLGAVQGGKAFARRPDEATVYGLAQKDVVPLPHSAWQLRDRRIWSFTTNQISRVTIRHRGETRGLQRSPSGSWSITAGSGTIINSRTMDMILQPLGDLRAAVWIARGDESRATYGFTEDDDHIIIELRNGEKPVALALELGKIATNLAPYGLVAIDGQTWIFEMPYLPWLVLARDLISPLFRPAP